MGRNPTATHTRPNRARSGQTEMVRVNASGGTFDALRADHFARTYPPHFHDTFALGVVEAGATRISTRGGQWIARAGSILAFSPGEVHAAEPLERCGYTYRMVYPSLALMAEAGMGDARAQERLRFNAPVIDDAALARELVRAHEPLMVQPLRGETPRLLEAIRRLLTRHAVAGAPADVRLVDRQLVLHARDYLRRHLAEPVRLATIAESCGVSVFHLIRVFHRVVGVPPYAYLVQLRVNRAQTLLATGTAITQAAYTCGFSDQSHLTRMFKRVLGVSPGQYARQVQQPTHSIGLPRR